MGISSDAMMFYGFSATGANEEIADTVLDKYYDEFDCDADFKCEVGLHCCDGNAIPFLFVKDSWLIAYRGHVTEIPTGHMAVGLDWDGQLIESCEKLGIKPPDKFGWCLVSWMG